ncbi:MAG: Fic family protein [Armatimonadota bacterium]
MVNEYHPPLLPPAFDDESKAILKQLAAAHRYLAELKGISKTIPNQEILITTLALQEAKDSSAVENIITTQDDLFKGELTDYPINPSAKEVRDYAVALRTGFELVRTTGRLTTNQIIEIHRELAKNDAGVRKLPGTALRNQHGETVYIPPQSGQEILNLLANLERYLNDDTFSSTDPLVKMAVMHFQFETIHPFYDGNGRTGRILNVLYLVLAGLLDIPVVYLSRYIVQRKAEYYQLLQQVREDGAWEAWVLFMLTGVEQTSRQTITLVQQMERIMRDYKHRIRTEFKFYSQELLNNLFFHPYTKIEFLQQDLAITRHTAAKYLDQLADAGLLKKAKMGRANYYMNVALTELLANIPSLDAGER